MTNKAKIEKYQTVNVSPGDLAALKTGHGLILRELNSKGTTHTLHINGKLLGNRTSADKTYGACVVLIQDPAKLAERQRDIAASFPGTPKAWACEERAKELDKLAQSGGACVIVENWTRDKFLADKAAKRLKGETVVVTYNDPTAKKITDVVTETHAKADAAATVDPLDAIMDQVKTALEKAKAWKAGQIEATLLLANQGWLYWTPDGVDVLKREAGVPTDANGCPLSGGIKIATLADWEKGNWGEILTKYPAA